MNFRISILAATLLASTAFLETVNAQTATPASRGVKLGTYREIALPNGARVILMPKKDVPLISFTARLRGGALTDPAGKEGLAALTATLLERGAGKRNAQQFAETVDSAGGTISTGSARESLVIRGQFLSSDSDLMLDLLSDMLRRAQFTPEEVEKARARSVEEIAAAKDSDLRSLTPLYFHAFHFAGHPYGRAVGGTEASIPTITREDVLAYYKGNFAPDRLILAIVGDFDSKAMEARVRKSFSDWNAKGAAFVKAPATTVSQGRRVLLVDKPDATQTYFWIGNTGIARTDSDRVVVDLANTVFGGRFTSMLNTELRVKTGLTYGANSQLSRETAAGAVAIASYTKTETTAQAVDLALDILKRYRSSGVDEAAYQSVKSYALGQFPPRLETAGALADRLTEISFYGLDRKDVDQYAATIEATSREKINQIVTKVYPDPANLTFVFIGSADKIRDAVKKYGKVTEMKITDKAFAPEVR